MQMRQRDVAALDAKYTKELADAKEAENDALRDDVAALIRRFTSAISVDALKPPPYPAKWMLTSLTGLPLNGIISPSEADHYALKQLEEPKYINEQCR